MLEAGGKTCPPTIVGVGVGGTADLCVHLAKVAATRPLGSRCEDPEGAKLEAALGEAVNLLGVGPQGLGGDSTAFAVHVETAATHITMNPVAVNMQCHSARRARATFRPRGWNTVSRLMILLLLSLPAYAAELEGVTLADRIRVDGQELQLNGFALRTRALFFKVYVAGLYLPERTTSAAAALAAKGAKRIHLTHGARR